MVSPEMEKALRSRVKGHPRHLKSGRVIYIDPHTRKLRKALKHYAPGLPDKKKISKIPTITTANPKTWEFGVHNHHAHRAGRHFDLRLGDSSTGIAHSWAIPKGKLPKPGEKLLAVRQPDHTIKYMDFKGTIGSGYGAGVVDLFKRGVAEILFANNDIVKFRVRGSRATNEYVLRRTKGDNPYWLMMNTTRR